MTRVIRAGIVIINDNKKKFKNFDEFYKNLKKKIFFEIFFEIHFFSEFFKILNPNASEFQFPSHVRSSHSGVAGHEIRKKTAWESINNHQTAPIRDHWSTSRRLHVSDWKNNGTEGKLEKKFDKIAKMNFQLINQKLKKNFDLKKVLL